MNKPDFMLLVREHCPCNEHTVSCSACHRDAAAMERGWNLAQEDLASPQVKLVTAVSRGVPVKDGRPNDWWQAAGPDDYNEEDCPGCFEYQRVIAKMQQAWGYGGDAPRRRTDWGEQ